MFNRYPIISLSALALLLSGCAGMNAQFGCSARAKNSCATVTQVNAKAQEGGFDLTTSAGKSLIPGTQVVTSMRAGYRVQRIWIAPYQDEEHNYHAAAAIYTVLKKTHGLRAEMLGVQHDAT